MIVTTSQPVRFFKVNEGVYENKDWRNVEVLTEKKDTLRLKVSDNITTAHIKELADKEAKANIILEIGYDSFRKAPMLTLIDILKN
ncbi:MAG: hypothetical protein QXI16_03005 [Sulfolobaceae archaeon]